MKRFANALVYGKFYPPHAGHVALVQHAESLADRVTIACFGTSSDRMTPLRRATALANDAGIGAGRRQHRVISGIDEAPFDLDSDTVWEAHVAVLNAHLGTDERPDVLVTSEAYGPELARRLGIAHEFFDIDRSAHPISGTRVRADPIGHWNHLGPAAQRLLTTRVVVVGAESTGTSTIAQALAERLRRRGGAWQRTLVVEEYGRELTQRKQRQAANGGPLPVSVEWTREDFAEVVREQRNREHEAAARSGPVLVCDTDALATMVWEQRYTGQSTITSSSYNGDIYLLTDHAGVPFVQDGMRDGEHLRAEMTEQFAQRLIWAEVPWVMLTGSLAERIDLAERMADQACEAKLAFTTPV